jgi:DNA-binding MarR family transcriptional regulator
LSGAARQPRPIYAVGELDHVLRRVLRERLAPLELTVTEFTTLSVIDAQAGMSNAQLARRSFITPQAMNEVLAALEAKGLIARAGHSGGGGAGHHRARAASVTELGRCRVRAAAAIATEIEELAFGDLEPELRARLGAILRAAASRLRAEQI